MAKSMAKVAKGRKKKHVFVRKQAPALTRKVWEAWMLFVKMNARLWIYFCLFLTGALGLRCGEALVADGQDFALEAETPNLKVTGKNPGGQKSPGCVYVPQKAFRLIKKAFTTGITVTREIKAKNGQVKKGTETFKAKKASSSRAARVLRISTCPTKPCTTSCGSWPPSSSTIC